MGATRDGRTSPGAAPASEALFRPSDLPTFRLWSDSTPRTGAANMAIDQALLDAAEGGLAVLRLYRWDPPCLSFGRNEPALRRYDRARIEALGLDVVRRPTGGRAVWHEHELTYAVACPASHFGDLRTAYRRIHEMLAEAVASLGAVPALAAAPAGALALDRGACFAAPAGGEVLVRGRKVVGSAQVRQGGAMLQHGSLLLAGSQAVVEAVTAGPAPPGGETSLADALGQPVRFEEAAAAIARAARTWSAAWTEGPPPDELLARAAAHELHFRSAAWTWRR